MRKIALILLILSELILTGACRQSHTGSVTKPDSTMMKLDDFASFKLTTDLSKLTDNEKEMIPLLIEAAKVMDDIFWM